MILEVTYSDGHHECFDSNSLTGGAVFGRANILTEFDVVWEEGEDGQHLVVYEHHMEESAPSDDERRRVRPNPRAQAQAHRLQRGAGHRERFPGRPALNLVPGGCLVDAAKFELACMKWYSGPMAPAPTPRRRAVQVPGAGPPRARQRRGRDMPAVRLPCRRLQGGRGRGNGPGRRRGLRGGRFR